MKDAAGMRTSRAAKTAILDANRASGTTGDWPDMLPTTFFFRSSKKCGS